MRTKDIIEGMQILSKYYEKSDGSHTGADHDIIFMYEPELKISEKDLARLEELNWDIHETGSWMVWT